MDMLKMMKQAASLQKDMKKKQKELANKKVEFTYKGILASVSCDMKISSIKIDHELIDSKDYDKIEINIERAVQGALDLAQKKIGKEMGSLTSGMNLPF